MIYKPELGSRVLQFLNDTFGEIGEHLTCCRHEPSLPPGTQVINTCAGCDRRYRELWDSVSTISLWEVLAEGDAFPFPNYGGQPMTVLDACPTRNQDRIHDAVRTLMTRMNITLVEPEKTRRQGTCCGDSFYGILDAVEVKEKMRIRAAEMPVDDVVVYCVSCCKSMHIGGKRPRYLLDLLFSEETLPGTFEPDEWHSELNRFIEEH